MSSLRNIGEGRSIMANLPVVLAMLANFENGRVSPSERDRLAEICYTTVVALGQRLLSLVGSGRVATFKVSGSSRGHQVTLAGIEFLQLHIDSFDSTELDAWDPEGRVRQILSVTTIEEAGLLLIAQHSPSNGSGGSSSDTGSDPGKTDARETPSARQVEVWHAVQVSGGYGNAGSIYRTAAAYPDSLVDPGLIEEDLAWLEEQRWIRRNTGWKPEVTDRSLWHWFAVSPKPKIEIEEDES